jgi:hypothetical protein
MLKDDAVQSGTHLPTFRNNVLPRSYTTNMKACLRGGWNAENKERLGKVCVLRHGVNHLRNI